MLEDKYSNLVNHLKGLDLESTPINYILNLLDDNTGHLCTTRVLKSGTAIYRARIFNDIPEKYPVSVNEVSYNPSPSQNFGRCHLIGEIPFYGCIDNPFFRQNNVNLFNTCFNSILETLNINQSIISRKYFVVSKWILKNDLRIAYIGNNLMHSNKINTVRRRFIESQPEYLTNFSESFDNFLANEFSKKVEHNYEYKISAAYSTFLKNSGIDCIEYPSVASRGAALNLSINKELIDDKIITPEHIVAGTLYLRFAEVIEEYNMKGEFSPNGNISWKEINGRLPTSVKNYYTGLSEINPQMNINILDLDQQIP